jgi:phosphonate utilization transcriptional regulator
MSKPLQNGDRAPVKRPSTEARTIAKLQSNSLPKLIQRELGRMIIGADFAPGSRLNESEVAGMLGVSRGPVREAFRGLEEAGLVRFERNRGVFVRQVDVREADEIYEVRAALDEYAGRCLAKSAPAKALAELRLQVKRLEEAAAVGDLDAYAAANLAFHDRLISLTGNSKLLETYRRLVNELNLYRRSALELQDAVSVSAREHREIVNLIEAGKVAAAGKALYEHATESRERMHRVAARSAQPLAEGGPHDGGAIRRRQPRRNSQ